MIFKFGPDPSHQILVIFEKIGRIFKPCPTLREHCTLGLDPSYLFLLPTFVSKPPVNKVMFHICLDDADQEMK
jgi:hypothetical protein